MLFLQAPCPTVGWSYAKMLWNVMLHENAIVYAATQALVTFAPQ